MKFETKAILIGVIGKKGSGTLDSGQAWESDRVELQCVVDFSQADPMTIGQTVVMYKVQGFDKHFERSKAYIGQEIILFMEMVPSKKAGQAAAVSCYDFRGADPVVRTKGSQLDQPAASTVQQTALPESVKTSK